MDFPKHPEGMRKGIGASRKLQEDGTGQAVWLLGFSAGRGLLWSPVDNSQGLVFIVTAECSFIFLSQYEFF